VTSHIPNLAAAEIPEAVPLETTANIPGVVCVERRRPDPQVPVDVSGHGLHLGEVIAALRYSAAPDMDVL